MEVGNVQNRRATIRVPLRITNHPDIEFVLDTGFAGFLTLPQAAVDALGLPYRQSIPTRLANGSREMMDTFAATIIWQNVIVEAEVLATGTTPLLGTALLDGSTVCITFTEGGTISLNAL